MKKVLQIFSVAVLLILGLLFLLQSFNVDNDNIFQIVDKGDVNAFKLRLESIDNPDITGPQGIPLVAYVTRGPTPTGRQTLSDEEIVKMQSNATDMLKLLLVKEPDLNAVSSRGMTALAYAVQDNNYDAYSLLLEEGANINTLVGSLEIPIIYFCLDAGEPFLKLACEYGADVNMKTKDGNSILHLAILNKRKVDFVIPLRETNFVYDSKNNDGLTPLDLAIEKKYQSYIDLIENWNNKKDKSQI